MIKDTNPLAWAARNYRDVSPGNLGSELERANRRPKTIHTTTLCTSPSLLQIDQRIITMTSMLNEKTIANEVLIGRTATGSRIFATVNVRTREHAALSVEHLPVEAGYKSLSFTWGEIEKSRRTISCGGCGTDWSVDAVTTPADGFTMEQIRRLAEIAKEWHLSDMQAGCLHMTLPADQSYDARKHITCPRTGYRYGSAWLVKVVPVELITELHEMFGVPMGE